MIHQNECPEEFIILADIHYIQFSISQATITKRNQVCCCLTRVFCLENHLSLELPGPQRLIVFVAVCQLLF